MLSQHSGTNYMDGVPVKIPEKYRASTNEPLPQAVINKLSTVTTYNVNEEANYDFTLEHNVLSQINEWKTMRNNAKEERTKRIRDYEMEKQQQNEEKHKQMLTSVSYPNAEDLSSDEENGKVGVGSPEHVQLYSPHRFDTILTPTVLNTPISISDEMNIQTISRMPCASTKLPTSCAINKEKSINTTVNKSDIVNYSPANINYSDFEYNPSNPFDAVELKTINDLDILAQVLNSTCLNHSNNIINNLPNDGNLGNPVNDINETQTPVTSQESVLIYHHTELQAKRDDNAVDYYYGRTDNVQNNTIGAVNYPYYRIDNRKGEHTTHAESFKDQCQGLTSIAGQISSLPETNNPYNYYNSATVNSIQSDVKVNSTELNSNNLATNHLYNQPTISNYLVGNYYGTQQFYPDLNSVQIDTNSKGVPDILKQLNNDVQESEDKRLRKNIQPQNHLNYDCKYSTVV